MAVTLQEKQKRIVHTLEGPLFVAAGAGSGKTFTLTQRVMYAFTPGSKPRELWADPQVPEPFLDSIDQVLAITFTEKAAEELKDRIRKALMESGMTTEAEKVDGAWISTIHGMCARIIRAHALDLGVDPGFSVVEYADDLRRLAVEHVLRREAARDARGQGVFDALLQAFNLENPGSLALDNLVGILTAILGKVSSSIGGFEAFEQVPPRPSHIALVEAYREIAEATSYANAEDAATAVAAIDAYVASERDLPALRACFAACGPLKKNISGMGKDEKAAVDAVRAVRTSFFADAYLFTCRDALDQLIPLTEEVQREYDGLKGAKGVLDNDDLLTRAYDALKSDPLVRAEFAGKFKMVMVDEFQDTAQQQVELVRLLCSPDSRELCTVGDAQQSIYRFRGADVSVFRAKRDEVIGEGTVCSLDVNYRSHADILRFADRIFGGESNPLGRDFLHLESCGEGVRDDAHVLQDPRTSRCQAFLVAGGASADAVAQKAAGIAARFRCLHDTEGFKPGQMVILMTRLTNADVYARAMRAAGLPCVVSGGTSVFRNAGEVAVIRALLNFLANPDDGEGGTAPLLASPMFGLGAQELLALATHRDAEANIIDSRSLTGDAVLSGEIMEGFGPLPLLDRARAVLSRALSRVGRDPMASIVRDAVNESGWLYRLERSGAAQDRAVAANVLKALAIVDAEQVGRELFPRLVARAFANHIDHVKEPPAALTAAASEDEQGDDVADAVRIMTIHASKGLEFPVVAVAECDGVRSSKDRLAMVERGGKTLWAALPNRFELDGDGDMLSVEEPPEQLGAAAPLPDSAAPAFAAMRAENRSLAYEEAARLLYVAITRAREVVVLALSATHATELACGHKTSLVGEVLSRILPPDTGAAGLHDLGVDKLDLSDAHPGDFQLIALNDIKLPGGSRKPLRVYAAEDYPALQIGFSDGNGAGEVRRFDLVTPANISFHMGPAPAPVRDTYSYTSVAAALREEGEDRAAVRDQATESTAAAPAPHDGVGAVSDGDPTALGSAFHAAAQWMVETGSDVVPAVRLDVLCCTWGCTTGQRERLATALERWRGSDVRAEALSWPQVRAEVPFFAPGTSEFAEYGAYAEGAIDLLCTDPADRTRALVIDYKTGGTPDEAPEALRAKHARQARIYADALRAVGYEHITCRFVRVEQPDPNQPDQPQVVTFEL